MSPRARRAERVEATAADAATALPFVFVTVGTDHHPWTRLMDWLDEWLERRNGSVRCFVQTGHTPPPKRAEWKDFLPYQEMERIVAEATAVVVQATGASVMLCTRFGKKPIALPRLRRLGEQIDDHQVPFGRRMAGEQLVALAETKERLHELLDQAVLDPDAFRLERRTDELARTVERFARRVDELLAGGRSRAR